MKELHELKMKLMEELKDQAREIGKRGKMNGGDLDTLAKLTKTIDRLCDIMENEDNGMSRDGYWEARGDYEHSGRGRSGRRGRRSMEGRSMSESYDSSRDDYDDNGMDVREELEDLMRRVNGREKEVLRRAMREIDK